MRRPTVALVLSTSLAGLGSALLVAPGSPCDQNCGNVLSSTTGADMTCDESAYAGSQAGVVFESCTNCELQSTYVSSGYSGNPQTDLQWLLYNMRFAISYCLFGEPNNTNFQDNPCVTSTACGPLKVAFEWQNFTTMAGAYDYCQQWPEIQVQKCSACLTAGSYHFVNNYLTILDAGCKQMPAAGSILSIQGTPFSTVPVNITTPSPTPIYTPPANNSPISLGGKVGIAIAGIVVLLTVAGCIIVCTGRHRRRAFLRRLQARHQHQGWPTPNPGSDMFETPVSQKPLRGWEDSPVSAHTEKNFPRYFSPYSSQYNSPVSAVEGPSVPWPTGVWPTGAQEKLDQMAHEQSSSPAQQQRPPRTFEIGLALGGTDPSLKSKNSHQSFQTEGVIGGSAAWERKGKERAEVEGEAYELHEVDSSGSMRVPTASQAPVLQHPGYGRNPTPPQTGYGYKGLTEEDLRRGDAL